MQFLLLMQKFVKTFNFKNMKHILLFILLIPFLGFAQNNSPKLDIVFGKILPLKAVGKSATIFSKDYSGIYSISTGGSIFSNKVLISHFNKDMNLVKSGELKIEDSQKKREFESLIQTKSNTYLFSSIAKQEQKKYICYYQVYSGANNTGTGEPTQIGEIDYSEGSYRNSGSFSQVLSPDSSKLLIYANLPYAKKDFEKYSFWVYDDKMKEVWKKNVELPYSDKLFEIQKIILDNKGNTFVLGKLYNQMVKERKNGEPNYKFVLISYSDNGNLVSEYSVDLPKLFLTDVSIFVLESGDISCTGFYSEKNSINLKGVFTLVIDKKSGSVKSTSTQDFSVDFITEYMSERKANKVEKKAEKGKDVGLARYQFSENIPTPDGGFYTLAEQTWVDVVTTYSQNGGTTTTYIYHYNNVVVIRVNNQMKIEWMTQVPKMQASANDGGYFSSYFAIPLNGKLYLLHNDNMRNINVVKGEKLRSALKPLSESTVFLTEIDEKGNRKVSAVFNAKEVGQICVPKSTTKISDNSFVMYFRKGKKVRLARLTLK